MAEELSQWVNAVAKLTALTQRGQLKWTPIKLGGSVGPSFIAVHKGRTLRLSRVLASESLDWPSTKREVTRLEFIDESGQALWSFPETAALDDLYQAAKFQAAGVQDFLTDILKD